MPCVWPQVRRISHLSIQLTSAVSDCARGAGVCTIALALPVRGTVPSVARSYTCVATYSITPILLETLRERSELCSSPPRLSLVPHFQKQFPSEKVAALLLMVDLRLMIGPLFSHKRTDVLSFCDRTRR